MTLDEGARLALVAIGTAAADLPIAEEGQPNWGREIRRILAAAGITSPAPWCAAFVQWASDRAIEALRRWFPNATNPLDEVKLEAYVPSYVEWATRTGRLRKIEDARLGDLVAFQLPGTTERRWNHMGILLSAEPVGVRTVRVESIDGNTNASGSREGTSVARRMRTLPRTAVACIDWTPKSSP